ncbi:hypothetical protein BCR37DRAFT_347986 [Protomyces lactucae-debilis]|uniref:Uncharacterized protein n=1 Tax=Protomyces lactucae-debilis TaxID=2754530 RepID=A0A1Y2FDE9_PROLT|nr:uncharacterized protein BCR37DRAFT_347986 [Protomyces lactucae-debilis]ORY81336.1 hypothetical protein BCR37DRAFT_347986 [Protomyces lactucae-debilis]
MSQRVTDPRFASVHNDPRFVRPKKKDRKVAVDKRFSAMLQDKDFSANAKVDRYGRKLSKNKGAAEIQKTYALEAEEGAQEAAGAEASSESSEVDSKSEGSSSSMLVQETPAAPIKYDPARGEGVSSSEEDSDVPDDAPLDDRDLVDPEPAREAIPRGDVTSRFALVNLDWDNLQAEDLFVAMNSFKPATGTVRSVTIFSSEFGKERMSREDTAGPPATIFKHDEEEDLDKPINAKSIIKESLGEEFDMVKLRQYQLDRLRYYYAIVECDSAATAKHIYDACDGAEYEASANFFDLRFVPDGEVFSDEPKDQCTKLPDLYEPNAFVTDALQHSKVKLTWDDDDPKKAQFAKRAFSKAEVDDMELKAYLASSSSSEGEGETAAMLKDKWRKLLKSTRSDSDASDEDKPSGDMEITFSAGLAADQPAAEEDPENETTLEKYKRKDQERRERRRKTKGVVEADAQPDLGFDDPFFNETTTKTKKKREKPVVDEEKDRKEKAELALLMMDDENAVAASGKKSADHFDMKAIVRAEKRAGLSRAQQKKLSKFGKGKTTEVDKEGLQDGFEIDLKDDRFSAVFDGENHHFALDPTSSQFKRTKTMDKVVQERRKRGGKKHAEQSAGAEQVPPAKDASKKKRKKQGDDNVEDLVRRVKSKTNK